ncbi:elongation factor Ts [Pseudomonas indoloxydans]|jgi:elongation factor Ts|uniref:Elongation factor Ts n=1 Tax=Ectopseudomonas oleovorans TaxID=301 RepID=A0A2S7FRX7_ECTOL|nr:MULTISPECIES: translation elongation factor Ts [Pseudomonas]KFJ91178.1 elongation factor Ts [Pseudomonas sp. 1-7]MBP8885423.1 elongation factor Ts [Pseudomonas sp.]MDH1340648.1 translation elongation factor Ts [Pseudomonas oleovorans]MDH1491150.1 translation elongation factor Ts [Pseudomonas oleovorans]OWK49034.1 Elongation factor Ts [Pseudomonas oleovorans subsp. oleovorans]
MAEITAALVKELRERTGQGMMECKKALVAAGGDIEKAIDDMRASGAIKAAKKAGNIAAEGSIAVRVEGGRGVIIEVNSQTDFLALQDDFKAFVKESIDEAFEKNLTDAAPLIASRESAREALVAKCGENVNIRRLTAVSGETVGAYLHGHRIGVLVVLKGGNDELAKHVAMHIAASNPAVVSPDQVSEELVAKEKEIFLQLNAEKIAGKPENIVENMVKGRIAKFLAEASLVEQAFIMDPEVKVGDLVKKAGAEVVSFVRYEVGEGIEKAETDFAAEVAAQVAASKQ